VSAVLAVSQADEVRWTCFVVGIIVLFGGVAIGLWTSFRQAPVKAQAAKAKLDEAAAKIAEAKAHIEQTRSAVAVSNLESSTVSAADATTAAEAAGESAEAAKTALEQVQGIVAALPENLRFAGLLVLVGTVLMGVATIQFGGVSLF
jgi:FtsZ-interacting cell division protein ZipA